MQRLLFVDSLKGIGIVLVVMGHLLSPGEYFFDNALKQFIYSFHMPLFFCMSGILFGYAKTEIKPLNQFIVKKAIALLLPYVSFLTLYSYTMDKSLGGAFFEEEVHYGYWFNPCLFLIMTFSYITDKLFTHRSSWFIDSICNFGFAIFFILLAYLGVIPSQIRTFFCLDQFARFLLFFQIGKLYIRHEEVRKIVTSDICYFASFVIYFVVFSQFGNVLTSVNVWSFVLPICAVVILVNVGIKYENSLTCKNVLPYLGKHSLEIYLIHFFFVSFYIDEMVIRCFDVPYLQIAFSFGVAMIVIAIVLIVCYLINISNILKLVLFGKGKYVEIIMLKL